MDNSMFIEPRSNNVKSDMVSLLIFVILREGCDVVESCLPDGK